jgi:hypothetical protein
MEFDKLKTEIKEIIEIVKSCPENLQEKCFEILLASLLKPESKDVKKQASTIETPKTEKKEEEIKDGENGNGAVDGNETDTETEISLKDFHIKTKKFFESKGINIEHINKLYYKDHEKILPLYEDLGTNKISETQIRVALLTAFENSFSNGDFEFSKATVRERCKLLKSWDANNASNNYRNNKDFFDDIDSDDSIKLSTSGKDELAKVLKELAAK